MTPAEHYAEAMRLRDLAVEHWLNPEGGYDSETPSDEERQIRAAVQTDARADAALWLAEAQMHATLALYYPPIQFELDANETRPQDHATDVTALGKVLTEEPAPGVTEVIDGGGDRFSRYPGARYWRKRQGGQSYLWRELIPPVRRSTS